MSRRAHRHHDAHPWETHAPDDDERARLDRLLGELLPMIDRPAVDPGDDDPVLPPRRQK